MNTEHAAKPNRSAISDDRRRQRGRSRRYVLPIAILAVALTAAAWLRNHKPGRFDPNMPVAEAHKIRRQAEKADDAETWLAIQEDVLMMKLDFASKSKWQSLLEFIRQTRSISKGIRTYELTQSAQNSLKASSLQGAAEQIVDRYKPRIVHAVVRRAAEIRSESNFPRHPHPEVLGSDSNALLSTIFEMQGRWGDASDQHWYACIDHYDQDQFEEVLRIQVLGSDFVRDKDIGDYIESIFAKLPEDRWLCRFIGMNRWREGKFAEAEPLLARAAELFSDDPEGRFAWAESRLALGLPVDAASVMGPPCRPSIHFETQEAMRMTFQGQLHAKKGDAGQARIDAEAAVKLDPRNQKAWALLADVSRISGDSNRADEAEIQARVWEEKQYRLAVAIRLDMERFRNPMRIPEHAAARYRNGLVDALRNAEWQRAADVLTLSDRLSLKIGDIRTIRNLPELHPEFPDRFFQARPKWNNAFGNSNHEDHR